MSSPSSPSSAKGGIGVGDVAIDLDGGNSSNKTKPVDANPKKPPARSASSPETGETKKRRRKQLTSEQLREREIRREAKGLLALVEEGDPAKSDETQDRAKSAPGSRRGSVNSLTSKRKKKKKKRRVSVEKDGEPVVEVIEEEKKKKRGCKACFKRCGKKLLVKLKINKLRRNCFLERFTVSILIGFGLCLMTVPMAWMLMALGPRIGKHIKANQSGFDYHGLNHLWIFPFWCYQYLPTISFTFLSSAYCNWLDFKSFWWDFPFWSSTVFRVLGNYTTYYIATNAKWIEGWLDARGKMYFAFGVIFAIRITRRFLGHENWKNPFRIFNGLSWALIKGSALWATGLYGFFQVKNWVATDRQYLNYSDNPTMIVARPIVFIMVKKTFQLMISIICMWFDSPWMVHYMPMFSFMTIAYLNVQSLSSSNTWVNFIWFVFLNWFTWGLRVWRVLKPHTDRKNKYVRGLIQFYEYLEWGRIKPIGGDLHAPDVRGWVILIEGYTNTVMLVMFIIMYLILWLLQTVGDPFPGDVCNGPQNLEKAFFPNKTSGIFLLLAVVSDSSMDELSWRFADRWCTKCRYTRHLSWGAYWPPVFVSAGAAITAMWSSLEDEAFPLCKVDTDFEGR